MQDRSGLTIRRYIASMLNHLKSLQAARNKQFDTVSTEDTVPVSTDNGYHFVQARGGFRYLGSNALLAARPDFLSVPGAGPASTATRLEFPPVASLAASGIKSWLVGTCKSCTKCIQSSMPISRVYNNLLAPQATSLRSNRFCLRWCAPLRAIAYRETTTAWSSYPTRYMQKLWSLSKA